MKKIILLFITTLALGTTHSFAQSGSRWGISGSYSFNNNEAKNLREGTDSKVKAGFNLSPKYQYLFKNGVLIDLQLGLDYKTNKYQYFNIAQKRRVLAIQMPIHVGYLYRINKTVGIFGSAGPYLAYGLWGQWSIQDSHSKTTQNLYKRDGNKRFEAGASIRVGVELVQHVQISMTYERG